MSSATTDISIKSSTRKQDSRKSVVDVEDEDEEDRESEPFNGCDVDDDSDN